ncbi:hypothetical protein HZB97_02775 [Candidatus Gottesmanbacteria bacterium]|nr:hypothetical protein [Candidatus Gottesmanbacteria bacterium]
MKGREFEVSSIVASLNAPDEQNLAAGIKNLLPKAVFSYTISYAGCAHGGLHEKKEEAEEAREKLAEKVLRGGYVRGVHEEMPSDSGLEPGIEHREEHAKEIRQAPIIYLSIGQRYLDASAVEFHHGHNDGAHGSVRKRIIFDDGLSNLQRRGR